MSTSTPGGLDAPDTEAPKPRRRSSFTHRLYTGDFQFDFVAARNRWYILSAVLLVISVAALGIRGLNLGIEFRGGSVFTAPVSVTSRTVDEYRAVVNASGLPDLTGSQVNTVGGNTVRIQTRSLDTDEVVKLRAAIADKAGLTSPQVNYSLIGPSWGQQITGKAIQALVVFLVLVALMIWLYFREWRMSVAALGALVHDLIITIGMYALVGFTVTPATLIGVLTILGYSLYDTVVVFDKVRENTHDIVHQNRTYSQAANSAVNQVLVRSINTTLIGVLPVLAILIAGVAFLGGEGPLADLGLALFIGMIIGAYSSIFIATPLLSQLREAQPEMRAHRAALERRRTRGGRAVPATVTVASSPISVATVGDVIPVTDTPDQHAERPPARPTPTNDAASGRPQPVRSSRSDRRKSS